MSDNKRYFWLKIDENFFSDDTISYIEEQENGILYSNFYLKLCLKSLKTQGTLIKVVGENLIPYDSKALSRLTGVDIDTVKVAMDLFIKIGLVKLFETGEIYLTQINELIGTETDKAKYMRVKRAKEKKVTMLPKCSEMLPYIEIEKDKEQEIELDKELEIKKELKTKKTNLDLSFISPEFEKIVTEWIEYKKERKDTYTQIGINKFYKNLLEYSQNNPVIAQQIIDKSISCNYKGIFPLQGNQTKAPSRQTKPFEDW